MKPLVTSLCLLLVVSTGFAESLSRLQPTNITTGSTPTNTSSKDKAQTNKNTQLYGVKLGDTVQVKWRTRWQTATVQQIKDKKFLVHYHGYSQRWDEWVGANRLKQLMHKVKKAPTPSYKKDARVLVKWGGSWWKAHIKQIESGRYLVHYEGWSDKWDEWVNFNRIKPRQSPALVQPPSKKDTVP